MNDSKALIERLRDYGDGDYVQNHYDRIEAADHIKKLEADNARLREANQAAAECVAAMMEECVRYRDEIRAALQETSYY